MKTLITIAMMFNFTSSAFAEEGKNSGLINKKYFSELESKLTETAQSFPFGSKWTAQCRLALVEGEKRPYCQIYDERGSAIFYKNGNSNILVALGMIEDHVESGIHMAKYLKDHSSGVGVEGMEYGNLSGISAACIDSSGSLSKSACHSENEQENDGEWYFILYTIY